MAEFSGNAEEAAKLMKQLDSPSGGTGGQMPICPECGQYIKHQGGGPYGGIEGYAKFGQKWMKDGSLIPWNGK